MHALLLEVAGKQRYIFGTNKLREAVGASELVAASTTQWLDAAIGEPEPDLAIDPVVRVSGRAVLTVCSSVGPERERLFCRGVLRQLTTRALLPAVLGDETAGAPGLHLLGVWRELREDRLTWDDLQELELALVDQRACGPQPHARLARLPVVAACRTSDGPAVRMLDDGSGDGAEPLSATSIAKRAHNRTGRNRILERLRLLAPVDLVAAGDLEKALDADIPWLGVVHADGNRVGQLVRELGRMTGGTYAENYQRFSTALDKCTMLALHDAVRMLQGLCDRALPLVPLIASGDDLTVLIDGHYALRFVTHYLRAFERHSSEGFLGEVATQTGRGGYLTAAAGVVMVKPHFPFSVAYQLCEQACTSAKRLSRHAGVSAVDWHVQYDSTGRDLDGVRKDLLRGDDHVLVRRPYAVLRDDISLPVKAAGRNWAELERLAREVPVLPHPESGDALPASQLQRLRGVLVDYGPREAERLFEALSRRPELALLRELGATLFTEVPSLREGQAGPDRSTMLLDFLDAKFVDPTWRRDNGVA